MNKTHSNHPPQFFISLYGWTYWFPIFLAGLFAIAFFWMLQLWFFVFIFLILTIACLAFYRDFDRPIPQDPNIMVAPADGKLTEISRIDHYPPFNGPALKLSIFLSVLDVHVNRSPCDGTVLWTRYEEGLFLDARHLDCSNKNQSNTIAIGRVQGTRATVPAAGGFVVQSAGSADSANSGNHFVERSIDDSAVSDKLESAGPYTEREALQIAIQVAKVLSRAHQDKLIHGQISPRSILISADGAVKLAKKMGAESTFGPGRPGSAKMEIDAAKYTSPEQVRGEADLDARADLYLLGATLYEMVTGRAPFEGAVPSVIMHKHLKDEVVPPDRRVPGFSTGIGEVITTAMAKKRVARYASSDEMLSDLERVAAGEAPLIARGLIDNEVPAVVVKQIVGAIARRIIAPLTPGESLTRGQRIGMIAFGSRTELYVPANDGWTPALRLNAKAKGGQSILLKRQSI